MQKMLFCLRAYQRLHDSITENVKNVITKMTLCSSLPKRPRLDSSNVLPSCNAQTIPTSTVSPDVAVSIIQERIYVIIYCRYVLVTHNQRPIL